MFEYTSNKAKPTTTLKSCHEFWPSGSFFVFFLFYSGQCHMNFRSRTSNVNCSPLPVTSLPFLLPWDSHFTLSVHWHPTQPPSVHLSPSLFFSFLFLFLKVDHYAQSHDSSNTIWLLLPFVYLPCCQPNTKHPSNLFDDVVLAHKIHQNFLF